VHAFEALQAILLIGNQPKTSVYAGMVNVRAQGIGGKSDGAAVHVGDYNGNGLPLIVAQVLIPADA